MFGPEHTSGSKSQNAHLRSVSSTARYFRFTRGADWPKASAIGSPQFSFIIIASGQKSLQAIGLQLSRDKIRFQCYTVFAPVCFDLTSYVSCRHDTRRSITC